MDKRKKSMSVVNRGLLLALMVGKMLVQRVRKSLED